MSVNNESDIKNEMIKKVYHKGEWEKGILNLGKKKGKVENNDHISNWPIHLRIIYSRLISPDRLELVLCLRTVVYQLNIKSIIN